MFYKHLNHDQVLYGHNQFQKNQFNYKLDK